MSTFMKTGHMLRYKKRLFKADWREEYVILLEDSTFQWYKDEGQSDPDGKMVLSEAPELLAFGLFADRLPKRPELPEGYSSEQLLAFGERLEFTLQWFLCESTDDVMSWMTAISNTLPALIPDINQEKKEEAEKEQPEGDSETTISSRSNEELPISHTGGVSLAATYTFCCGYGLGSGWGWFIDADGASSSCTDPAECPPMSPMSNNHEHQGEYLEFDCSDFGADFIAF